MLTRLTKSFRIKAAIVLAVAYAFCVLAPTTGLAFADAAHAVPCLTDHHGLAAAHNHGGTTHVHTDGNTHRHADNGASHKHSEGDGKAHPGNCCGLFCMSALATDPAVTLGTPAEATALFPAADTGPASRGPDRINRPPIA